MNPLLLLIAAGNQSHQVELRVTYPDGKTGVARTTRKPGPEGGWVTMMAIELESGSKKIKVRAESITNAKFEPVRKTMETLDAKGKRIGYLVADFGPAGAQLVTEIGAKRDVKRYDLEEKWPRKDPTMAWFLTQLPKPGTKSTFMSFELSPPGWVQRSAIYVGTKTVRIGNQTIRAYDLQLDEDSVLLDQYGMPIRLESKGVIFQRLSR
ncbi:MAG: hypothetical protein HONBIEJF_01715 [Fimbriimonadaceae bacterium]|nr:hypothetical protein [Fimbriimonadaceae bacterium]